jgi:uncharacterized membrane protein YtjA (UPF0391 family)
LSWRDRRAGWGTTIAVRAHSSTTRRFEIMLSWALTFLVVAIIAAIFGFAGLAGTAAWVAKILFIVFLVMFLVALLMGRRAPV